MTVFSIPTGEPVVRTGDKIQIHCPECIQLGTHLGTCSWSQMRSGEVWAFFAERATLVHTGGSAASEEGSRV